MKTLRAKIIGVNVAAILVVVAFATWHKAAGDLYRQLNPMVIAASPFAKKLPTKEAKGVRFVRPEVVGEVEFRAWTAEGYVRHAYYRGMREDKPAAEVVRERVVKS